MEQEEDEAEPLPIKLPDGTLEFPAKPKKAKQDPRHSKDEAEPNQVPGEGIAQDELDLEHIHLPEELEEPELDDGRQRLLDELAEFQDYQERAQEAQMRIAEICTSVTQAPEKHLPLLGDLHDLCSDQDPQISRLAMLSLSAVFNDILPGYKIRLPTAKELAMPVSKEVQKVRSYESALLSAYQKFVKTLVFSAKHRHPVRRQAAVLSLCELAVHHPNFNYADNILTVIVKRLDSQEEAPRAAA